MSKKIRKLVNPKISHISYKTLVFSIICSKCSTNGGKNAVIINIQRRRKYWDVKYSWFNCKSVYLINMLDEIISWEFNFEKNR